MERSLRKGAGPRIRLSVDPFCRLKSAHDLNPMAEEALCERGQAWKSSRLLTPFAGQSLLTILIQRWRGPCERGSGLEMGYSVDPFRRPESAHDLNPMMERSLRKGSGLVIESSVDPFCRLKSAHDLNPMSRGPATRTTVRLTEFDSRQMILLAPMHCALSCPCPCACPCPRGGGGRANSQRLTAESQEAVQPQEKDTPHAPTEILCRR